MKKQLALALALAIAPLAASAGELSYTYVEADFSRTTVDIDSSLDADFEGYAVRGSAAFGTTPYYAFGGYATGNNDDFGVDIDVNESQLGLGYHHSVADNADFVAELSYINQEVEFSGFGASASVDGDGYRAAAGFRAELANNFEGLIKVNYTKIEDADSEFSPSFGVQWKFNQTWGLVGEAELASDVNRYLVGVRASF